MEVVSLFEEASNIIVPTIVIGELYAGFYIGTQSSRNIRELQEFLDQVGLELKAPDKLLKICRSVIQIIIFKLGS